jgi:hypothetical protein
MKDKCHGIPDGPKSDPDYYRRQVRTALVNMAAGHPNPEPKPDPRQALDVQGQSPQLLDDPIGPLTVRIIRQGGRPLDTDNLVAGCKELRDAIASAIGRLADDEKAGMFWEYDQAPGPTGTLIEIRRKDG